MATRFKTTAFTRFLIMLIIVAPLAYMGASYYNGQDPIENLKRLFTGKSSETTSVPESSQDKEDHAKELRECREANEALTKKVGELEYRLKVLEENKK